LKQKIWVINLSCREAFTLNVFGVFYLERPVMELSDFSPGTTIKFHLGLKFSTNAQDPAECNNEAAPLALTFAKDGRTSSTVINFVPYTPGGVNYIEGNGDVLSGIFSGCIMSIYTCSNQRRVAHVHTGDDAGEGRDCKAFMKDLMATDGYNETFHFQPFNGMRNADRAIEIAGRTAFGASGCCVFGLVTASDQCYSIFTRKIGSHEFLIEERLDMSAHPYTFA
jgi:hypothetical protein